MQRPYQTVEEEELLVGIENFPLKFHYNGHVLLSFEIGDGF